MSSGEGNVPRNQVIRLVDMSARRRGGDEGTPADRRLRPGWRRWHARQV